MHGSNVGQGRRFDESMFYERLQAVELYHVVFEKKMLAYMRYTSCVLLIVSIGVGIKPMLLLN